MSPSSSDPSVSSSAATSTWRPLSTCREGGSPSPLYVGTSLEKVEAVGVRTGADKVEVDGERAGPHPSAVADESSMARAKLTLRGGGGGGGGAHSPEPEDGGVMFGNTVWFDSGNESAAGPAAGPAMIPLAVAVAGRTAGTTDSDGFGRKLKLLAPPHRCLCSPGLDGERSSDRFTARISHARGGDSDPERSALAPATSTHSARDRRRVYA